MRRPAMRGVPDRLLSRTPGRRLIAALCAIGATALAAGAIIGAGLPGSSQGASRPKSSGASTVQRRDLVATDTESGTLSYATPQTVFNRMSGTITSLPSVGQVVSPGGTLYQVDGQPIVLMNGSFPAYRDLSPAVSDGQDVLELNQNLVNLGFDAGRQITVDTVWQAATTSAVERWQASVGETQTGTVTLGQLVFLPGPQRITAVNTTLGSTGGSGSAGSGSGSGTGTAASTTVAPRTEFVSLMTTKTTASAAQRSPSASASASASTSTSTDPTGTLCPKSPPPASTHKKKPKSTCPAAKANGVTPAQELAALIALLKAETVELGKTKSPSSSSNGSSAPSKASKPASTAATSSSRSGGGASGGSGSGSSGAGSSGTGSSGTGSSTGAGSSGAGSTAQAIMTTSSTQLVVTVNLDATKQSEAVVGEPVTVQLPTGGTVDGKISKVSPVAQTSSSSSAASGSGAGGASSTPTATIPVTITLAGHQATGGLDQAAVSVNFQQQKATGVLSVPVTALLATAGGGYAVQEAAAPHSLLPVTPGLFAAGYVQISGSNIFPGLQVTDSQG